MSAQHPSLIPRQLSASPLCLFPRAIEHAFHVTIQCSHHSDALSLSQIKSEHIGGVARRELGDKECFRPVRRRARPARPSPRIDACAPHYNISDKTAAHVGGAALRTQQRGQGIPVGSEPISRSAYPFCHGERGDVGRSRMPIDRSRRTKTLP